ncbi:MAG: hypothetical protein QXY49_00415 [Thermofilaceae archaeon]
MSLKEEFLRLLKENEEFRLAVAVYLDIKDLTPVLDRLVRAGHSLRKSIAAQSGQLKSQTESINLF